MKIFIDGMLFRHTGMGRIYENLLDGLIRSDEIESVSTLVPFRMKQAFQDRFSTKKVSVQFTDMPNNLKEYLYKGQLINQMFPGHDIYHFVSSNVPFFLRGMVVSTVCDLITISPLFGLPWHRRWRFEYPVRHAINRSTKVVCISEFTKSEVCRLFGTSSEKLFLIYPPLAFPEDSNDIPPPVDGDYLLYVGNRHVHKNLRCLLAALRLLAPEFPKLKAVVAGARMTEVDDVDRAMSDSLLRNRMIPIQDAGDAVVRALYSHARAFVFPSLIEGFGIPPLEALHAGIPVVCSDVPVLREVCGDSVRYANPRDPADFARAIREVLTDPPAVPQILAGRAQALKYSTADQTQAYIDLFRRTARL
jgi:glycosyltransferase involved in cell wall biosynthesis